MERRESQPPQLNLAYQTGTVAWLPAQWLSAPFDPRIQNTEKWLAAAQLLWKMDRYSQWVEVV